MNRKIAVLSAALALASQAPAMAADKGEMLTNAGMAPVKAVWMVTSAVVGTPISVARYVAKESVASTKSLAGGDKANPFTLAAASLLGVPIGLVVGGTEGLYYGSANAYSKPFGKDAFSLGEIE